MATLTTSKVAQSVTARELNAGLTQVTATYSLTAALAASDVIQMVKVPTGARIIEMLLAADDLDTNATPTIVLDVGDGGDTDRFIDGATSAQVGGGLVRLGQGLTTTAADALGYTYTADDTIDVLVQAGPATGATTGDIVLTVIYSNDA